MELSDNDLTVEEFKIQLAGFATMLRSHDAHTWPPGAHPALLWRNYVTYAYQRRGVFVTVLEDSAADISALIRGGDTSLTQPPIYLPTAPESERLAIYAEEMCEAGGVIGKINRRGFNNHHPADTNTTNRSLLAKETADVLVAIELLVTAGDITVEEVATHMRTKRITILPMLFQQGPNPIRPVFFVDGIKSGSEEPDSLPIA